MSFCSSTFPNFAALPFSSHLSKTKNNIQQTTILLLFLISIFKYQLYIFINMYYLIWIFRSLKAFIQIFFEIVMAKKSLEEVIAENSVMGFEPNLIQIAYANVDGNADRVLEEIIRLQEMSNQVPQKPSNPQDQDAQLSKAIELSMNEAKDKKISLQPLNPQQRIRKSGIPVGLKNIGNTCYFNSLLQTYFQNSNLVKEILAYNIPEKYKKKPDQKEENIDSDLKRKRASCQLVENMKILFARMINSDRKYLDPTDVISSIVDDYGNDLAIGDQKDIGQFNLVFLSRVDEGLDLLKKEFSMDIQGKQEEKENSPSKINVYGDEKSEELSLIPRSSIKIEDDSIIKKEFLGLMQNSYHNDKQNIHKSEQELFSLLFINIRHNQLYNALEEITLQHIDDYRNEKGEVVGVEKQSWIKEAPKTLFFQIDRVIFNKEKSILQKINDEFDFPLIFYIDPFLHKNKQKALEIQKKVKTLRIEKQKYKSALRQLEKHGQNHQNLGGLFSQVIGFLSSQGEMIQTQKEIDNPLHFPTLASTVKKQHMEVLLNFKNNIETRIKNYQQRVEEIDAQIEKCYASIRSTPYYLYSILIHEGSADSGHYYSYTYDYKQKKWWKYNDINISEEVQPQVLKEAKGMNYTSAYYLVYTQEEVLAPKQCGDQLMRNYNLSTDQMYKQDYFSTLLSQQLQKRVQIENGQLYEEIQQYRMGGFVNRVIENYIKKFQICNQIHRKTKPDKKKNNTPPLLINFPVYMKQNHSDQLYRNCLMENAILEYGPKDMHSPIFLEMIKKKVASWTDFKKPKEFSTNPKFMEQFIKNVYLAQAAKKLFEIMKDDSYYNMFSLVKELKSGQKGDYFDWVCNLLCKILVVRLLMESESNLKEAEKALEKIDLAIGILFNFINFEEEKSLLNNAMFWMTEMSVDLEPEFKEKVEERIRMLGEKNYNGQFDKMLRSQNDLREQFAKNTDTADAMWNLSRKENTLIDRVNQSKDEVKGKMGVSNEIYQAMKKQNLPLKKQQRQLIQQKHNQ